MSLKSAKSPSCKTLYNNANIQILFLIKKYFSKKIYFIFILPMFSRLYLIVRLFFA